MRFCSFLLSILLISSCSSRKFDFSSAYKFSSYQPKVESVQHQEVEPILIASRGQTISGKPYIPSYLTIKESQQEATLKLNKKERTALKKELKKSLKKIRKVVRADPAAADIMAEKVAKEITDDKVYAGAVIGIAGLILLILDIVTPLGVLAVVVGLALIVWGLLERGPRRI